MRLDMLKIARILERGVLPIELAQPAVDVRVSVADGADVALEVHDVDGVEADLGNEQRCGRYRSCDEEARTIVTKRRISASVRRSPTR